LKNQQILYFCENYRLFPSFATWQTSRTSSPKTPKTSGDIIELKNGPPKTSKSKFLYFSTSEI